MEITFILPFNYANGGHRVVATYARHLIDLGHRVNVISQPYDTRVPFKKHLKALLKGQKVSRPVPPPPSDQMDFLGDRHKVLDKPGAPRASEVPDGDVIIATWWETAEWVAALPASKGRKLYLIQDYEVFPHLSAERVSGTYRLPLTKIAVSDYIRDTIAANHGVDDITVIPNAVDHDQFRTPERRRNDTFTVGFLYSSATRKNIRLAISAMEKVRAEIPDVQLRVFGTPPIYPELPLPDWARYERSPAQTHIPEIYAACDVWLFTSTHEGFGLPVLEALACRTPVLATAAGAAPQLVDGTNGTILPPEEAAFTQEILRFARMSDSEWQDYSAAAYRTATGYSWADATDRLLEQMR